MAKGKRRRGISAGTVLMLLVTIGCIGVGGWVWERIAGDADFTQFQPARLMQTLAFQGESARVMTEKQSNEQPQTKRAPVQPPATVLAPTPTPAPTARVITLHAVGQIQLDATLRRAYYDAESETYDYSEILQPIAADMAAADLTIATLESTLAGEDAEYGNYNAPDVLLDALKVAGVDLINLSTERILDFGLDGLKRTRDVAESMGFAVVGANRSADEKQMQSSFQINGIRGVILSYTYGLSSTGARVGDDVQRANAVNLLDVDTVKADVARARMQGAEVVIVNVHWGKRSDTKPSNATRALADSLVNCGADVILGTHPTAVQTLERRTVQMSDGTAREVLLAYSLGNFLTNERDSSDQITGMLLELELTMEPGAAQVKITNARYMPTWVMRYKEGKEYRYRVIPASLSEPPVEMSASIYQNMKKSYESTIKTVGTTYATPW